MAVKAMRARAEAKATPCFHPQPHLQRVAALREAPRKQTWAGAGSQCQRRWSKLSFRRDTLGISWGWSPGQVPWAILRWPQCPHTWFLEACLGLSENCCLVFSYMQQNKGVGEEEGSHLALSGKSQNQEVGGQPPKGVTLGHPQNPGFCWPPSHV